MHYTPSLLYPVNFTPLPLWVKQTWGKAADFEQNLEHPSSGFASQRSFLRKTNKSFYSFNLDFGPVMLVVKLDLFIAKMYLCAQNEHPNMTEIITA